MYQIPRRPAVTVAKRLMFIGTLMAVSLVPETAGATHANFHVPLHGEEGRVVGTGPTECHVTAEPQWVPDGYSTTIGPGATVRSNGRTRGFAFASCDTTTIAVPAPTMRIQIFRVDLVTGALTTVADTSCPASWSCTNPLTPFTGPARFVAWGLATWTYGGVWLAGTPIAATQGYCTLTAGTATCRSSSDVYY